MRDYLRASARSVSAISALFALGTVACDSNPMAPPAVAVVAITPATATIEPGDTVRFAAVPKDASNSPVQGLIVTWSSSDTTVATVSSAGLVRGVAAGQAKIVATIGGRAGSASVTVTTLLGIGGLWDFTEQVTDFNGVTCADTGTISVAQVRATFAGTLSRTGGTATPAGLGICDTAFIDRLSPAVRPLQYNVDTVTEGTVARTGVSFVLGYVVCQYAATLMGSPPVQMSGTLACMNNGGRLSTGSWKASYRQPVGAVVVAPGPLPPLVVGTQLGVVVGPQLGVVEGALEAVVSDTGGRRIFGRVVDWSSDDPGVASVKLGLDGLAVVSAVSQGSASIVATAEGRRGMATMTVEPVSFTTIVAGAGETWGLSVKGWVYHWGCPREQYVCGTAAAPQLPMPIGESCRPWPPPTDVDASPWVGILGYCGGSRPAAQQFATVSYGLNHACGLTTAGAAYCWGDNSRGQLGDGSTQQRSDTPVPVAGGLTFATLGAGFAYTCGVTTGSAAYCWGSNDYGQLGDGSHFARATPTAVAGGLSFVSIGAGTVHTCGVVGSGGAYCWGFNGSGNLGDGTTADRPTPVVVAGGQTFASVAASGGQRESFQCDSIDCYDTGWVPYAHTCGITTEHVAVCWGDNLFGQTGPAGGFVPTSVSTELTFAAISTGPDHTCALTTAGTAYCWGDNVYGGLGNASTVPSKFPVKVGGQP